MGMFCNYIINAFRIYPIVRVIKLHSAKEDGSHPVFTYLIIRENKNKTHLFFRWVLFLWSSIISKFLAENLEYYTDLKRKIRRFQKLYYGSGNNDDEKNLS